MTEEDKRYEKDDMSNVETAASVKNRLIKNKQLGEIRIMENDFFPQMSRKMDENVGKKSHWRDYAEPAAFLNVLEEQLTNMNYLRDKEIIPICSACGRIKGPTIDRAEALAELENIMVNIANYAMIIYDSADRILTELVPESGGEIGWPPEKEKNDTTTHKAAEVPSGEEGS